jgi:hypothetical protein
MNDNIAVSQTAFITGDWQSWLVLRHLLPARLQRLFLHEVVRIASGGKLSLADLVEEIHVSEPIWNECWLVRPRLKEQGYRGALQSWVRSIVWQSDTPHGLEEMDPDKDSGAISGVLLDTVGRLSAVDLAWPEAELDYILKNFAKDIQPALRCFLAAFRVALKAGTYPNSQGLWLDIAGKVETVDLPLRAMMLKHISDLLAVADEWRHALDGYGKVQVLLDSWTAPKELADVANAWKTITMQCHVCARGIATGYGTESSPLVFALDTDDLDANPVLAANAGIEAVRAQSVMDTNFRDRRVSLLSAPLLAHSHNATFALDHWLSGAHQDADREFRSLVKRQVALGAITQLQTTRAWHARSLFDHIAKQLDQQDNEQLFEAAAHLIVEAENPDEVERVKWTPSLVDACVRRDALVDGLVALAGAHQGSKLKRTAVLVAMFKTWAIQLTPSRPDLASRMWRHIAKTASEFESRFETANDVGRAALKALQDLGEKRPELRSGVASDVSEAICRRLHDNLLFGQAEAANAALPYVDALDEDALRRVAQAVLGALEAEAPVNNFWPLHRAAIRFLVDPSVRKTLRDDDAFNTRCIEQILRVGFSEESRQSELLVNLVNFDPKLLEGGTLQARIGQAVEGARKGTKNLNSSDLTNHINALLVAPSIAGHEGVRDALAALIRLVRSAKEGGPRSMNIPYLAESVLLLTDRIGALRSLLADHQPWFDKTLNTLAEGLAELWTLSATNPLLFASMAIPLHTKPNPVLVHNCAFASLRFSRAVGREAQMADALRMASENPALMRSITLARETDASGAKFISKESHIEVSPDEDRKTFYDAIGRRLVRLQRLPKEDATALCRQLVENCLRLGPDAADSALLVAAANLDLHDHVRKSGLANYRAKVEVDRNNRLLLLPLLDLFMTDSGTV